MKKYAAVMVGLFLSCFMSAAIAADARPYKDGPVSNVSFIKIKPGKFDEYMRYLATTYKAQMEEHKKTGLVLSYAVYSSQARSRNDADVILMTTYKNMATLDRQEEFDANVAKVMGTPAQQDQKAIDRESMRELIGSQLMRELILK